MEEQTASSGKMKDICYMFSAFRDPSLEKLYQNFSVHQKHSGLECFLITAILFDVYMLVVPSGQDFVTFFIMSCFLVANCLLLVWCKKDFQNKYLWIIAPHISFHIANTQILSELFLKMNEVTTRDSLGWFLLLTYLVYVTLPLRLPYCILLSIAAFVSYIASLSALTRSQLHFIEQVRIVFNTNVYDYVVFTCTEEGGREREREAAFLTPPLFYVIVL